MVGIVALYVGSFRLFPYRLMATILQVRFTHVAEISNVGASRQYEFSKEPATNCSFCESIDAIFSLLRGSEQLNVL
jgi:hypothetical protein